MKKEAFHLRGHNDIVRGVKLSPDGKIGLSISSDKSFKVWDINTHKVLKNWEFHQDSIHSITTNDNFTRVLTGSRTGEIYLTDLSRGCYCLIDKTNEPITSLALNKNNEIYAATSQNKLIEYKIKINKKSKQNSVNLSNNTTNNSSSNTEKIGLVKKLVNDKIELSTYITDFSNEIVKFHLMKNKIYILCLTSNKKLMIYNVIKLSKIAEFEVNNYTTFEKLIEILDKIDQYTLKSWFSVDIKLGVLTITFQSDNFFVNPLNFDFEYLEKVLDKTENFSKNANLSSLKFFTTDIGISSPNHSLSRTMNSSNNLNSNQSNFSHTMPNKKYVYLRKKFFMWGLFNKNFI